MEGAGGRNPGATWGQPGPVPGGEAECAKVSREGV